MYAGEIIEKSPTEELFENPQHPYTQGLLASTPDIDDPEKNIEPIPGSVPNLIDPEPCHFAPRCPESTEECFNLKPDFRTVAPNHEAACLHRSPIEEDETLQ
jgi:oligopeptide/dipeptide ABC transporter ATP-binding protein